MVFFLVNLIQSMKLSLLAASFLLFLFKGWDLKKNKGKKKSKRIRKTCTSSRPSTRTPNSVSRSWWKLATKGHACFPLLKKKNKRITSVLSDSWDEERTSCVTQKTLSSSVFVFQLLGASENKKENDSKRWDSLYMQMTLAPFLTDAYTKDTWEKDDDSISRRFDSTCHYISW